MKPACSITAPLSSKQMAIWSLITKGLSVSAIADKLNTTRQYVNQTRLTAEAKLSTTLLEVARTNDLPSNTTLPKASYTLRLPPSTQAQSHHNLHNQPRLKSLVLARQSRRSYRHCVSKPDKTVPDRYCQRKGNRDTRRRKN